MQEASSEREWLQNPGFEDASGGIPRSWFKFLSPACPEGSAAEWINSSELAYSRSGCIKIFLPENPIAETYTNWSQNILNAPIKRRFQLQGYVKTLEAEGVELWLQCFDTERRLLANTSSKTVYGTNDWTLCSTDITIPDGATILTVRCVLLGKGTAWFDDLSVKENDVDSISASTAASGEQPEAARTKQAAPTAEKTLLETNRALLESNKLLVEQLDQLRKSFEMFKEDNERVTEQLRSENETLKKERDKLRIETLQKVGMTAKEQSPAKMNMTPVQPFLPPH